MQTTESACHLAKRLVLEDKKVKINKTKHHKKYREISTACEIQVLTEPACHKIKIATGLYLFLVIL